MRARTAAAKLRPAVYIHEATIVGMTARELSKLYPQAVVTPCTVGGVDGGLVVLRAGQDESAQFVMTAKVPGGNPGPFTQRPIVRLHSLAIYRRFEDG